jgi:hypothetical protein
MITKEQQLRIDILFKQIDNLESSDSSTMTPVHVCKNLVDQKFNINLSYLDICCGKGTILLCLYLRFWVELEDIIQNIEDQIIPIYDKHFTNEELVGFIEFFKTDVGRVYLNKMGIVALETMQIGNKYGELVYNKLVEIAGKHTEDQSPK